MGASDEFRQLLEAGDVAGLRKAWGRVAPHLPQPDNNRDAEIMMHHARTQAESVTIAKRLYSHAWLTERGIPSGLPEKLKPLAQQVEQKVAKAVGIAVMAQTPEMQPLAKVVERAMSDAVEDCYANGDTDDAIVRARMFEARRDTLKAAIGR